MALREKFGRLVLLEETEAGPLGQEFRAARLGPAGLDRLVTVLRFSPAVSAHPEATKLLLQEARLAARISGPGLVRALGVGRVDPFFYLSSELVEGRTVTAILAACRAEAFPFAADHALMIASRAAVVLELLHARQDDSGRALFHGLLSPQHLAVAFDGEVKLKRLGLWPALRGTGLLPPEQHAYLAPEQLTGPGEPRSDVYALGLVLLETLSGQGPDGSDPLERLAAAHFANAAGEKAPLPQPLAELLRRALGHEPGERFQSVAEMRKAIDAVLFCGDFAPTTFDLAFFMHTLFREDVEREAQALEEARAADYREFLTPEAPPPAVVLPAATPAHSEPLAPSPPVPTEVVAPALAQAAAHAPEESAAPGPHSSPATADVPASRLVSRTSRDAGAREAASRLALGSFAPGPGVRRPLWLVLGLVGAVVVGGGAGWVYFAAQRRSTAPPASDPQVVADARVKELEARIAQLEREKADAEARAAEDAGRKIEQQAAAGGRTADPAAVARAQEEARQQARLEQERKQQEELRRLAEEKRAEQQRLATEAAPKPAPTATPAPEPAPTPTPLPPANAGTPAVLGPATATGTATSVEATANDGVPPPQAQAPSPTPAAEAGTPANPPTTRLAAVDPADPAVKLPVFVSEEPVPYPARALPRRLSASVVVRALLDESGRVVEAAIVQPSGQPAEYGFDEAALKRVRSRRYRPARRNDVPVPIWVVVRVEFRPPAR